MPNELPEQITSDVDEGKNRNGAWTKFKIQYLSIAKCFIPTLKLKRKIKNKHWLNNGTRLLIYKHANSSYIQTIPHAG